MGPSLSPSQSPTKTPSTAVLTSKPEQLNTTPEVSSSTSSSYDYEDMTVKTTKHPSIAPTMHSDTAVNADTDTGTDTGTGGTVDDNADKEREKEEQSRESSSSSKDMLVLLIVLILMLVCGVCLQKGWKRIPCVKACLKGYMSLARANRAVSRSSAGAGADAASINNNFDFEESHSGMSWSHRYDDDEEAMGFLH